MVITKGGEIIDANCDINHNELALASVGKSVLKWLREGTSVLALRIQKPKG